MGERLLQELSGLMDHPKVGDVRGVGLLIGIEMVEDKESRDPAEREKLWALILSGCKQRGLIVGKNGDTTPGFNNVLTLCPPLNLTDEDLKFVSSTLKEVIGQDLIQG